jgi:hypothetical protein
MPGGHCGRRGGSSALASEIVGKLKDDLYFIKIVLIVLAVVVAWMASRI